MAVPVIVTGELEKRREELEIDLLLEGIYQFFGADFRGRERSVIRHRLHGFMQEGSLKTVSSLQDRIMHDPAAGDALLRALTKHSHALFDDGAGTERLREFAAALLRSFAAPKVWLAECTTPEELFSVAILLEEEGIRERTMIYATCSNQALLQEVREGRFDIDLVPGYERNYLRAGGKNAFSRYWSKSGNEGVFSPWLASNITWAQYDFSSDFSFNEFQLIVCRVPLAHFGEQLRRRTLSLFTDSLCHFGILSVDRHNNLSTSPFSIHYSPLAPEHGLYRRTG
jgi:chemotaxis protein methyltransferase CheR